MERNLSTEADEMDEDDEPEGERLPSPRKPLLLPGTREEWDVISTSAPFLDVILNQVAGQVQPLRFCADDDQELKTKIATAATAALMGIAPKGELETMLAAQMIATHAAAMDCYRRAMLKGQPFQARESHLGHASRLCRTYAALLEALNRHRGKGQQKATVEHVHVHEGGQAIVGLVEGMGEGGAKTNGSTPCS